LLQGSKGVTSHASAEGGTEEEVAVRDKDEVDETDAEVKNRRSTRNATKANPEKAKDAVTTKGNISQKVSVNVSSISVMKFKMFLDIKLQRQQIQNLIVDRSELLCMMMYFIL
jgi:hypothetical protein